MRYVLQSVGGLYFQSTPARPLLTKDRNRAREFDCEVLADCFRRMRRIDLSPKLPRFRGQGEVLAMSDIREIWEVQHFTLCDGWINTFTDGEERP